MLCALLAGCQTIYQDATVLTGSWTGTYTCLQGLTGVTFTFHGHPNGLVDGLVEFYAVPENPNVPSGSLHARGAYFRSGELNVYSDESDWIERPETYNTVDFIGAVSPDLTYFAGDVEGNRYCKTFYVERD